LSEDERGCKEGEEGWRWRLDVNHCPLTERFYIVRIGDGRFKCCSGVSGRSSRVHVSIRMRANMRKDQDGW
jgi:hypothetical protein